MFASCSKWRSLTSTPAGSPLSNWLYSSSCQTARQLPGHQIQPPRLRLPLSYSFHPRSVSGHCPHSPKQNKHFLPSPALFSPWTFLPGFLLVILLPSLPKPLLQTRYRSQVPQNSSWFYRGTTFLIMHCTIEVLASASSQIYPVQPATLAIPLPHSWPPPQVRFPPPNFM